MGISSMWLGRSLDQTRERFQAVLAFSAAWFAFAEIPLTIETSDELLRSGMRMQLLGGAVHVAAWIEYERLVRFHGREMPPMGVYQKGFTLLIIVLALVCFVPTLSYTGAIQPRTVEWLGVTYRDIGTTPLDTVVFVVLLSGLLYTGFRFSQSAARGVREAIPNLFAIGALFVTGTIDALTVEGLMSMPYVLSIGFFISVGISWSVVTQRLIRSTQSEQQASRQLAQKVDDRTKELTRTHEDLQRAERLAGLGRLAAGVAHEINNPAAVVISNIEYVMEELKASDPADVDDLLDALNRAQNQMRRVEGIVGDMLDTGRIAGSREVMNRTIKLTQIVKDAQELVELDGIELEINIDDNLEVVGHDRILVPVVRNLIANARDAVRESGSKVTVSARESGEYAVLTVTDDGPGMPKHVAARIFEPFFTTKPPGEGTGMGLSVSLGLVRTIGGDLTFETEPEEGTTMILRLFKPRPFRATPIPVLRGVN